MLTVLRIPLITAVVLGTVACGGNVVATTGSGGGAGNGGSSSTGGSGGVAGVDCNAGVFPAFSKTCTVDGDCVTEIHQTDCCGSTVAIGVSQSASVTFDAAEKACEAMYPGCGCAGTGPVAEDGKLGSESQIQVACQMGACMTFVP
jgi:hypothetical protein